MSTAFVSASVLVWGAATPGGSLRRLSGRLLLAGYFLVLFVILPLWQLRAGYWTQYFGGVPLADSLREAAFSRLQLVFGVGLLLAIVPGVRELLGVAAKSSVRILRRSATSRHRRAFTLAYFVLAALAFADVFTAVGGIGGLVRGTRIVPVGGIYTRILAEPLPLVAYLLLVRGGADGFARKFPVAALTGLAVLQIAVTGAGSSRSSVIYPIGIAGLIAFSRSGRSGRWQMLVLAPVLLVSVFVVTTGFKENSLGLADEGRRGLEQMVFSDLTRGDVQATVLDPERSQRCLAGGRTYIAAVRFVGVSVPHSWLKASCGYQRVGFEGRERPEFSAVYGALGEASLNFGLLGAVVASAVMGSAGAQRLDLARLSHVLYLFLVAVWWGSDFDNTIVYAARFVVIPLMIVGELDSGVGRSVREEVKDASFAPAVQT